MKTSIIKNMLLGIALLLLSTIFTDIYFNTFTPIYAYAIIIFSFSGIIICFVGYFDNSNE